MTKTKKEIAEKAIKVFPRQVNANSDIANAYRRDGFMSGYIHAQGDLALTWEDMLHIHRHIKDAMNLYLSKIQTTGGQQEVYEEVLRRFNKERNKV